MSDKERIDIINLSVRRLPTGNGIQIYAKSALLEDFMRANLANPATVDSTSKGAYQLSNNPGWSAHQGYKLASKENLKSLMGWGQPITNGNAGRANIAFLTAKGLRNGVTFEFDGLFSQTAAEVFISDVRKQVFQLYMESSMRNPDCVVKWTLQELS